MQARPSCTKRWNEAHVNKNTCPATGRRCLRCGRLNYFARVCKGAANDRKDKLANAMECEQQTNAHSASQEENFFRRRVSVLAESRKIPESNCRCPRQWHSHQSTPRHQTDVTVVTEKHYGKLNSNCLLQEKHSNQELLWRREGPVAKNSLQHSLEEKRR